MVQILDIDDTYSLILISLAYGFLWVELCKCGKTKRKQISWTDFHFRVWRLRCDFYLPVFLAYSNVGDNLPRNQKGVRRFYVFDFYVTLF